MRKKDVRKVERHGETRGREEKEEQMWRERKIEETKDLEKNEKGNNGGNRGEKCVKEEMERQKRWRNETKKKKEKGKGKWVGKIGGTGKDVVTDGIERKALRSR